MSPLKEKQVKVTPFTVELPNIPENEFSIADFGAIGDGIHKNTDAIQQTISACSNAGGGKVIVPAGIWLTGPVQLKSKINLHLESGAILLFSKDYADYPLIVSSFEGKKAIRCQSPIDGEGLEDIAITGNGTIDGNGQAWRPIKRFKMTELQWNKLISSGGVVAKQKEEIWWPTEAAMNGAKTLAKLEQEGSTNIEDYLPIKEFLRPNLLSLRNCNRILLDGPTFQNSPAWNLHPLLCQHITMQNITVRNPWFAQNGDGLDLESCRYAVVKDSVFDVGDDALCIKSGKDEAGRQLGVPSEDIRIERCEVYSGHGGFVVGSEMSGGVRNIIVNDCSFYGTDVGIRFKTTRGRGGLVENIAINKIRMNDIAKEAIIFHMFYESDKLGEIEEDVTEETPVFRNVTMEDITCTGADTAVLVRGLPEMPVEGLVLKDITILSEHGVISSNCTDIVFSNMTIGVANGPLFDLKDCKNVSINELENLQQVNTYLKVNGAKTKDILFEENVNNADKLLEIGEEVNQKQVKKK